MNPCDRQSAHLSAPAQQRVRALRSPNTWAYTPAEMTGTRLPECTQQVRRPRKSILRREGSQRRRRPKRVRIKLEPKFVVEQVAPASPPAKKTPRPEEVIVISVSLTVGTWASLGISDYLKDHFLPQSSDDELPVNPLSRSFAFESDAGEVSDLLINV